MSIHTRLAVALFAVFFSYHTVVRAQLILTSVSPTTVCAGSSITVSFTNNDPESSSLSLYLYPTQSADSLAISQPTNVSGDGSLTGFIPTNQLSGSYRVRVKKVSSHGAISMAQSDSFSIHAISPPPTVKANSFTYCQYSSVGSLTATATDGGSLLWYGSPSGGFGISPSPTPSTMTPGSSAYYVSQLVNGCESFRTSISVVVNASPPPPAVTSSRVYCQGASASSLSASGSNLNWYTSSVGGLASASVVPTTNVAGLYSYYVSQTINGCESPRSVITVIITPTPSPPLVNSVTYCQGSPPIPLTVTAGYSNTINWYTTPTGGSATSSITPSTSVTGTTTFYVSQVASLCESSRAALTVTVTPNPTVTITSDALTLTPHHTSISLTATTSASSLIWSGGDTTSSITVNAPGDYSVTVRDGNGCSTTSSIIIDQSPVEVLYSVKAGDWNDPSVWSTNQVPTNDYAVRLHHIINIPTDYQAQTQALRYRPGGRVQLGTGSHIKTGP